MVFQLLDVGAGDGAEQPALDGLAGEAHAARVPVDGLGHELYTSPADRLDHCVRLLDAAGHRPLGEDVTPALRRCDGGCGPERGRGEQDDHLHIVVGKQALVAVIAAYGVLGGGLGGLGPARVQLANGLRVAGVGGHEPGMVRRHPVRLCKRVGPVVGAALPVVGDRHDIGHVHQVGVYRGVEARDAAAPHDSYLQPVVGHVSLLPLCRTLRSKANLSWVALD